MDSVISSNSYNISSIGMFKDFSLVMMTMAQLAIGKPVARIQHWHKLLLDSQSCSDSAHSFVSLQGS